MKISKSLIIAISLVLLSALQCVSQELETPLAVSVEQIIQFQKERHFPQREARSFRDNGIELPFIDDFSRYSLPTNDPSIPEEWQMWTDAQARINSSLGENAPTQGVITFDGLSETGYPYDFTDPEAQGAADTLTSCPIDLSGKTAADSVKLVFHYQEGGLGDSPTVDAVSTDSIYLQFLVPLSNPVVWQTVWSTLPTGASEFQRVFVDVDDDLWLESNFQFRFINYGRLSANADHWNLDYIWLDENIVEEDFQIVDISPNGNPSSMLLGLRSMPWHHYQAAPPGVMLPSADVQFSNLDEDRNITFGSKVFYDGEEIADANQGLNTALNGFSTFNQNFSINDGNPINFAFPTDVADTCAEFEVKYFCNTSPDLNSVNDTVTFTQHFENYYAYDDGSAESGYSILGEGSALSLKYNNVLEDTLLGVLIHFNFLQNDESAETFLLRAWDDAGGSPGNELAENFVLHQPQYFADGYDIFTYYEFDQSIGVPAGNFHVGLVQTNQALLAIGLDKSLNTNGSNLKFRSGPFGIWTSSSVSGSLMIRPVFKSDKPLEWDFVDIDEVENGEANGFSVYPNPVSDVLNSELFSSYSSVEIYNSLGAQVMNGGLSGSDLYVGDLPKGVYLIKLTDGSDEVRTTRFIKK